MFEQPTHALENRFRASLNLPFEHPKVVGFNANFFGIFLNQVLTICRMLTQIHVVPKITSYIMYIVFGYENSVNILTLQQLSSFSNFLVNVYILIDTINPSYLLKTFGDYRAGMTMSRVALFWNLDVHVLRYMMLVMSVYNENMPLSVFNNLRNTGNKELLVLTVLDVSFVGAFLLYALALLMKNYGWFVGNKDEFSHPWIEQWETSFEYKEARTKRLSYLSNFLLVADSVFLLYFSNVFLHFKQGKDLFHYSYDDVLNLVLPLSAMGLVLFDNMYRIYRRNQNSALFGTILFNKTFLGYFYMEMVLENRGRIPELQQFFAPQMRVLGISLAVMSSIGLAAFLVFNFLKFLNFLLWFIKWGFSIGGVSVIIYICAVFCLFIGTTISSYSLLQDYFFFNLRLNPTFKAFLEIMKVVFDVVIKVLDALMQVMGSINGLIVGIFCIILLVTFKVVVPVLNAIGFGVSTPVQIAGNIFEVMMAVFKIIAAVKSYSPLFESVASFTSKSEQMEAAASMSASDKMKNRGMAFKLLNSFGIIMILAGMVASYFHSAERYNSSFRPFYVVFLLVVLALFSALLPMLYLLEYLFNKRYDLMIMIVNINGGWGLLWIKLGIFIFCAGLILMIAAYLLGTTLWVRNALFVDALAVEQFVFPSFLSIICPLLKVSKKTNPNDNASAIICNRLCCCCLDPEIEELDGGNTPAKFLRQIFCPVCADLDPMRDDTRVVNLASNFCCCCLYCHQRRVCNPLKICFCICNCRKLQAQKALEDEMHGTEMVSALHMKRNELTYADALAMQSTYELEKRQRAVLNTAPGHSSKFSHKKLSEEEMRVREKLGRSAFVKALKLVFQNGFKKFAQYLIPIIFTGLAYYFFYKALMNPWLSIKFSPDALFGSVLSDTSSEANSDHVEQVEKSDKAKCPILDMINEIKKLIFKAIFSILKSMFPEYKGFLDKLEVVVQYITNLEFDLIPIFLRIILMAPAILFCVGLTLGFVISSFIKPFTRLVVLVFVSPCFFMYIAMLAIPGLIKSIVEMIPFFMIKITEGAGLKFAKTLYFALLFIIVMSVVDHFLPPTYPKREDAEKYVEFYDKEVFHPYDINP